MTLEVSLYQLLKQIQPRPSVYHNFIENSWILPRVSILGLFQNKRYRYYLRNILLSSAIDLLLDYVYINIVVCKTAIRTLSHNEEAKAAVLFASRNI